MEEIEMNACFIPSDCSNAWVRDLTEEGVEPNPGPACHKCGKHGHDGKACKLSPADAKKSKKAKEKKKKESGKGKGGAGGGSGGKSAMAALAASVSDGLAAVAGKVDGDLEKAKEKAEKDEPEPIVYGRLPTNGKLEINHKVFEHPDFEPNPKIIRMSTSVREMFFPTFRKNWKWHCVVGLGVAGATLLGSALSGGRVTSFSCHGRAVCSGTLAIAGSVLKNVYGLMRNLVVRTYYKTERVVDQAAVDAAVGQDTEIRPERMHHSDKIKYADPTTVEMSISDALIDTRDDTVYASIPRKRGLNVSLELFSQFAGYTMLNTSTREFYLGLQRDMKRMCSIRFERFGMAMGTIFNDTALFVTAHKLSEMTKRDMHEQPLN